MDPSWKGETCRRYGLFSERRNRSKIWTLLGKEKQVEDMAPKMDVETLKHVASLHVPVPHMKTIMTKDLYPSLLIYLCDYSLGGKKRRHEHRPGKEPIPLTLS